MRKLLTILLLLTVISVYSQKQYDIGILLDRRTEGLTPLLLQLQDQIKAVVGEDADINFPDKNILTNDFNLQKAEQNYNVLLNNEVDIILAFGVVNSEIISSQKEHVKPTILFGAVNKDFNAIDLSKETSGIKNFTYLIESESFSDDFKTFNELTDFSTLGIIIEQPLTDFLPLKNVFDEAFKTLQANYKLIPFDTVTDITSNLDGVDAVYMAGGFFLTENEVKQLASTFIEKKLPSFTSLSVDQVKNGIMATHHSDENFDQFMRRIALSIEGYINGTPLADMPVFIDYNQRLTINFNVAEQVNVPIKYSLINDTDFVGNMENTIAKQKYDLLQVIDEVINRNLTLKSNQMTVTLSEQDVKSAKSNYLPNLSANTTGTYIDPDIAEFGQGQNPEFSTDGNITLQQTIFSEAANANIAIQKALLKAQEANFNASQLDAIFDISNAYFNALILKANVQIQMRNLNLTKRNLQIAEQNYEAGESGKSDMLRFQSEMAQNTQAMIEAINGLEQSFLVINQLLNNPLDTEIDIEDTELGKGIFEQYNYDELTSLLDDPKLREPFIAFLVEEAKQNAPELKVLDYNLNATNRQVKLYGTGRFLPSVALQGQYNRNFSRSGKGSTLPFPGYPNDNYNVVASLSIPVFNQNTNNINKQIALIQKDQLQINKENTRLAIDANIRNGVLNLINQISNIELSRVSEASAKEALELTQTSYSTGAVTVIQLIDAQNNYLNAQLASMNATYNYLINALQLERYLGYYFVLNSEADNATFRQRFLEFINRRN
ncbi:TolC family protein [Seonamhaeicola sp.]|uniref:TolC family protein n=1 Tax=Seonamhaeicola sp. TaxID=1912245 RepID=UPI0026377C80|nr:TolC family protein [Seonamhaeicola sp.]